MAIRDIVLYAENEPVLRKKSKPVETLSRRIRGVVEDLKDTLNYHTNGIGLAAPQIGVHWQVVVVRLGGDPEGDKEAGPPRALINPQIVEAGDEWKDFDGCLSFPNLYAETTRPHHLRVVSLDEKGQRVERTYDGFDAVVVHHEIDHLHGVLFIDRVESIEDMYQVYPDRNGELVRVPLGF
ncbi:MAG: peptide deformylase [Chloroflexota bacterium]|nr:peptide deformylase [Chloroflexota bacterium]